MIKNHDFLGQYYYSGVYGTCWAEYVGPIIAVHETNRASGLDLEVDTPHGSTRYVYEPKLGDTVSRHKTPRTVTIY